MSKKLKKKKHSGSFCMWNRAGGGSCDGRPPQPLTPLQHREIFFISLQVFFFQFQGHLSFIVQQKFEAAKKPNKSLLLNTNKEREHKKKLPPCILIKRLADLFFRNNNAPLKSCSISRF